MSPRPHAQHTAASVSVPQVRHPLNACTVQVLPTACHAVQSPSCLWCNGVSQNQRHMSCGLMPVEARDPASDPCPSFHHVTLKWVIVAGEAAAEGGNASKKQNRGGRHIKTSPPRQHQNAGWAWDACGVRPGRRRCGSLATSLKVPNTAAEQLGQMPRKADSLRACARGRHSRQVGE